MHPNAGKVALVTIGGNSQDSFPGDTQMQSWRTEKCFRTNLLVFRCYEYIVILVERMAHTIT